MRSFLTRAIIAILFGLLSTAAVAGILVNIDISEQKMQVRENGTVIYSWSVSTGRPGYRTPAGKFGPTRMHVEYYSKTYDNAPMPYSIFFHRGYAIHGTYEVGKLGRVASHGCVRLHTNNARTLFKLVRAHGAGNTEIVVHK